MLTDFLGKNNKVDKKKLDRIYAKFYLSPKFRRDIRKRLMKLYVSTGKAWNDGVLSEDSDPTDRNLIINTTSMTGSFLRLLDKVEENIVFLKVKKRRFSVYLHKSKKKILFELRFFHVKDAKKRMCSLIIFEKWGKDQKMGGPRIARRVSKKGYILIDSGTYFRRVCGWNIVRFIFRGKKSRMIIKIKYTNPKAMSFYVRSTEDFLFFR